VEKEEFSSDSGGMQICTTTLEINLAVSQKKKKKVVLPEEPAIVLLVIYPKDVPSYHNNMCSCMFIEVLFTIGRNWKQPKCPSTKEWLQKMWFIYTMKYYSAITNKVIMNFAGKYM
jgi:hypothetical protein